VPTIHERLELAAIPRNLALIHNALDRFEASATASRGAAVTGVYDAFRTATVEIATNILRHAYPPDHPQPAHSHAPLTFELCLFSQRIEAIFHDRGIAFSPPVVVAAPALDEIDDILNVPEGNFGLFLALQALDHLDYSRSSDGVNGWRLIKRLA
jgi:anti-sigma regulatory factor (Ser/Thr protein kinase)